MSEELIKSDDKIKDIPNINDSPDIIKAAREGRLIIFIGAGVSKLINVPLWAEFAKGRLDTIYKKNVIDFRTYSDLLKLDPRKLLTICNIIMQENNIQHNPAKEVFKFKDDEDYCNVYSKLYSINAIYITTNYDECLDIQAMKNENISRPKIEIGDIKDIKLKKTETYGEVIINRSEILESKLTNGNVIHLHGSIKKEEDMVVTINDYLNFYGNISIKVNPILHTFLNRVFNSKYLVLFMGYGLEEYEILEYLLSKGNNPNLGKHYMLYPSFKEEYGVVNYLCKYYLKLGVELIPYNISKKGYNQLTTIIEEWSKVLSEVSREPDFIQKTLLIDEKINDEKNVSKEYLEVSVNTVSDLIKKDEYLETYFFDNISDKIWLPELIDRGFYKPDNIPIYIRNGYGYWNKADFLIKIARELKTDDENYINLLISIIKDVSLFKDDDGKHIYNYHIWRRFIEIISLIPNNFINIEIIKLIKIWLDSETDAEYVSYDVAKEILIKYLNSEDKNDIEKLELIVDYLTDIDDKGNIKINNFYTEIFNTENVSKITNKCSINLLNKIKDKLRKAITKSKSNVILKCDGKQFLLELKIEGKYIVTLAEAGEINYENFDQLYEKIGNEKIATFDITDKNCLIKLISEFVIENTESTKLEKNYKKKILTLYHGLFAERTYRSLYDFEIKHSPYGHELLLNLFLKMLINYNNDLSIFLIELLNDEYFIFQKVLLYVIGNNTEKYISIFWNILNQEKGELIFENAAFGDELRVILEKIETLNEEQQNILLKLIAEGPNKDFEEYDQIFIDVWKQKRLNSLKHLHVFGELYEKIRSHTKINPKLGPIIGRIETKWSGHVSPLTLENLLEMDNQEIAEYIKNFKTKDFWEGPSSEGLKDEITVLSKKYPNKIINDMDPFMNTNSYYIHSILTGIREAWKSKETFDWDKVFLFIQRYIERESFWNNEFQYNDGYSNATYKWVIDAVSELISEGTKDMSLAFEFNNYDKAKEILISILNNIGNLAEENDFNDYTTYVLNSVKGNALEALIDISLYKKNKDNKTWDLELKEIFEKYLSDNVMDSYIIFGLYLPQFYYLNIDWTSSMIKKIEYKDANWEPFMCGYLDSNIIYGNIYLLMKEHYTVAISHEFKDNNIKDKLAEHIGVGVASGVESEIDYQLFNKILEKWDYQMLEKLIWYFSSQNSDQENSINLDPKVIDYIINFWDTIYNKYNNYEKEDFNENDKKIISRSAKLVKILGDINEENYYLLKFSLPYTEQYESYVVTNELYGRLKKGDDTIKRKIIGELILIIVNNCLPDFEKDKMKQIVDYLYQSNDQEVIDIANDICNNYQMCNRDFLKDIYLKYNK